MGESIITGTAGAAAGIALGFGGAALVGQLAPKLSATVPQDPGATQSSSAADATRTIALHLTAPVTTTAIVLAAVLALAGGLIAGSLGGWRATRLHPAEALSRV